MAQLCPGPSLRPSWLLSPHSKTALTSAGYSITTQSSSPRFPPRPSAHPRPAATQPSPLGSSEQRSQSMVRQRVAGSARLAWERAREGGPYLPRQSRGSFGSATRPRPASRARLEYIYCHPRGRGGGAGHEQRPRGARAPATRPLPPR